MTTILSLQEIGGDNRPDYSPLSVLSLVCNM
jgi:hypothetical protein